MINPTDLVFSRDEYPVGRLVCQGEVRFEAQYRDADEWYMQFIVPSFSEDSKVYGLLLRIDGTHAGEAWCPCKDCQIRKASIDGKLAGASPREWEGHWRGVDIMRPYSGLCKHLRLVRRWVIRHKLEKFMA